MDTIITQWESRRVWSQLPQSFEHDAVKRAYESLKPYFTKAQIKQRIAASKATTFSDLRDAVKDCK